MESVFFITRAGCFIIIWICLLIHVSTTNYSKKRASWLIFIFRSYEKQLWTGIVGLWSLEGAIRADYLLTKQCYLMIFFFKNCIIFKWLWKLHDTTRKISATFSFSTPLHNPQTSDQFKVFCCAYLICANVHLTFQCVATHF